MALHLVKLCVGIGDISQLRARQEARLRQQEEAGEPPELRHVTRMTPRRRQLLLDGGSLYWVIRGAVRARQRLRDLRPWEGSDGISRCALILDPEIVETEAWPHRPFQGWRYLDPQKIPPDLTGARPDEADMPPEMRAELRELGLI